MWCGWRDIVAVNDRVRTKTSMITRGISMPRTGTQ
jgi:hypothetical protein